MTFSLISNTSKGNITQFDKDGGSLTYEPNHTFSGNDSFTFKASDGIFESNLGKVVIQFDSKIAKRDILVAEQGDVPLV